ncbi:MAG TPA: hypothetical protein VHY20_15155 [Pirellulales bacterium]|jgi:hypothetical protein|nr:hypothetical protein [Pirellulales bacterium]
MKRERLTRLIPTVLLAVLLSIVQGTAVRGLAAAEPANDSEPPQLFYLESGDKKTAIELDKPFASEVFSGKQPTTLRVETYRVFPYAGLKFRYPREYTFDADMTEPGVSIWTLSGNSCVIMVQLFKGQKDHTRLRGQVADAMLAALSGMKRADEEPSLKLKDQTISGERLLTTFGPVSLVQDLYSFPSGEDAVTLILQDTPQDNGQPSADRVRAGKLFCETLELPAE